MGFNEELSTITLFRKTEPFHSFDNMFFMRMNKVYDNLCFLMFIFRNQKFSIGIGED